MGDVGHTLHQAWIWEDRFLTVGPSWDHLPPPPLPATGRQGPGRARRRHPHTRWGGAGALLNGPFGWEGEKGRKIASRMHWVHWVREVPWNGFYCWGESPGWRLR